MFFVKYLTDNIEKFKQKGVLGIKKAFGLTVVMQG